MARDYSPLFSLNPIKQSLKKHGPEAAINTGVGMGIGSMAGGIGTALLLRRHPEKLIEIMHKVQKFIAPTIIKHFPEFASGGIMDRAGKLTQKGIDMFVKPNLGHMAFQEGASYYPSHNLFRTHIGQAGYENTLPIAAVLTGLGIGGTSSLAGAYLGNAATLPEEQGLGGKIWEHTGYPLLQNHTVQKLIRGLLFNS